MGYLSILHTEKYRGSFYEFNEGCTPRSSRSSDWNYPVDFWRGKNGIDKIAFQYWFGEYDELENSGNNRATNKRINLPTADYPPNIIINHIMITLYKQIETKVYTTRKCGMKMPIRF